MKKAKEERRWVRVPVQIPVFLTPKDHTRRPIPAEILDISLGGAFIHSKRGIPLGMEVQVEIQFRESRVFEAKVIEHELFFNQGIPLDDHELSIVRWSRENPKAGFGIEFVRLRPESRAFIEKLLKYFEHLHRAGVSFTHPK